ncbi:MAG TPA: hypothetical protein VGD69_31615 [Herpetosiphonaceae bacterium]
MILLISGFAWDPTILRLSRVLQDQSAEHVIVSPESMEQLSSLHISNTQQGQAILRLGDQTIDLATVRSAFLWRSWVRQEREPGLSDLAARPKHWSFFREEWRTFSKGLALTLAYSGVFCVNPPPFNSGWEEKCGQMLIAAQCGLRIPPTLYTARLPVAREFYDEQNGQLIYKPFRGFMELHGPTDQVTHVSKLYTNRVREADLVEGEQFIPTPSIFQPYIEKAFELRIVVVGRRIFACAIHSQQSDRSREDWRRYDLENTPYLPYTLPAEIEAKLLAFMDRLGLVFGSIDMIVTPDGEYIFLEINPGGQFDWIAQRTGMPIYQHVAALLSAAQIDYPTPEIKEAAHVA